MFDDSVAQVMPGGGARVRVISLARDYASDAKSYLAKGDFYTAFSCISYAHGLLDALKEIGAAG